MKPRTVYTTSKSSLTAITDALAAQGYKAIPFPNLVSDDQKGIQLVAYQGPKAGLVLLAEDIYSEPAGSRDSMEYRKTKLTTLYVNADRETQRSLDKVIMAAQKTAEKLSAADKPAE